MAVLDVALTQCVICPTTPLQTLKAISSHLSNDWTINRFPHYGSLAPDEKERELRWVGLGCRDHEP